MTFSVRIDQTLRWWINLRTSRGFRREPALWHSKTVGIFIKLINVAQSNVDLLIQIHDCFTYTPTVSVVVDITANAEQSLQVVKRYWPSQVLTPDNVVDLVKTAAATRTHPPLVNSWIRSRCWSYKLRNGAESVPLASFSVTASSPAGEARLPSAPVPAPGAGREGAAPSTGRRWPTVRLNATNNWHCN